MRRKFRLTILAIGAALLSACESVPFLGDDYSSPGAKGFAAGSALGGRLASDDERLLNAAFIDAMELGEAKSWRGRRAAGAITPAGWSLANLKSDPAARIPAARENIDIDAVLETELGLYVLTRNSNVRVGPGTEYGVAEILHSGAGVDIVGRTVRDGWMLVMHDGKVRGFVSENLMIKAPGTELELAGGPRRRAALCREFVQRLSLGAEQDQWTGAACRDDSGQWRLAREPEPPAEEPALLLID